MNEIIYLLIAMRLIMTKASRNKRQKKGHLQVNTLETIAAQPPATIPCHIGLSVSFILHSIDLLILGELSMHDYLRQTC